MKMTRHHVMSKLLECTVWYQSNPPSLKISITKEIMKIQDCRRDHNPGLLRLQGSQTCIDLVDSLNHWSWIFMRTNIIQFLEIIYLNSLACTVKCLGRSRWMVFILWVSRLKLDFHACIYNWNSFFILCFLTVSVACIEHWSWSSRVWAHRTIAKTSTSTPVKCLRRFSKRCHGLIVWVTRMKLDAGVQVENSF